MVKVLAVKGGSCIATAPSEALLLFKKPLAGLGAEPQGLSLPLLSGSGESENVRISLAECGSQQPEFAARNTVASKSAPHKHRGIIPLR